MAARVFRAPLMVTASAQGVLADHEIVVEDGLIIELRPARRGRADEDLADHILIPGLINAHVHAEFLLLKGLLEDQRLHDWENNAFFRRAWRWIKDVGNGERLRPVYRASYLEMIQGGTTFVAEFNCADAAVKVSKEVLAEVGLGGVPTVDLDRRDGHEAIEADGCFYALNDEEELSEEELSRARSFIAARASRLTLHAAETAERMEMVRRRFGKTTIELLDRHGLLGPWMLLSHAVHLSDAEIESIARSGAAVVASPSAEMKLADGAGPFARLVALGVPVALGTDAAVCNNGCDMFLEMRSAGLLAKLTSGASALPAESVFAMATSGGARALGLEHVRGSLAPGRAADLVAIDARSPRLAPVVHRPGRSNVVANLVYAATASDVTDVWIAGVPTVRARHHVRLDQARVLSELDAVVAQLLISVAD